MNKKKPMSAHITFTSPDQNAPAVKFAVDLSDLPADMPIKDVADVLETRLTELLENFKSAGAAQKPKK